jgi:ribosomal protein S18 acetylase RimI-like enzyme
MRSVDERISLRPATATDTHVARVIHHRAVRDVVMRQFGTWDEAAQDRFFDNTWNPEHFEIVEYSGNACGYFRREHHQTYIEIHEINIDPACQGQGIGTRILMDALADADQLGLPVVLQTLHLNRAAGLYQRLGFGEVGRTATHIRMQRDCPPTRR